MTLTKLIEVSSEFLNTPRKVWVQPAILGPASDCLIFLDAELYMDRVKAPDIVHDLQITGRLPPVASIYVSYLNTAARHIDFTCNETYSSFVSTERFYLCGLSLSGLAAAFTAIRHPAVFSGVLSQSPSAWWNDGWLAESLQRIGPLAGRYWISVGNEELQEGLAHPPSGLFQKTSQLHSVRDFAQKLSAICGHVHYNEFSGGHDPACWAEELPQALTWLIRSAKTPLKHAHDNGCIDQATETPL
jgi:enterochelin esterase family protein